MRRVCEAALSTRERVGGIDPQQYGRCPRAPRPRDDVRRCVLRMQVRRPCHRYPVPNAPGKGCGQGSHEPPRQRVSSRSEEGDLQGDQISGQAGANAKSAFAEVSGTRQIRGEDLDLRCRLNLDGQAGRERDAVHGDRCPRPIPHQHPAGLDPAGAPSAGAVGHVSNKFRQGRGPGGIASLGGSVVKAAGPVCRKAGVVQGHRDPQHPGRYVDGRDEVDQGSQLPRRTAQQETVPGRRQADPTPCQVRTEGREELLRGPVPQLDDDGLLLFRDRLRALDRWQERGCEGADQGYQELPAAQTGSAGRRRPFRLCRSAVRGFVGRARDGR